ncbi:Serine/threonine-protein phosphatase 2A activator 1 [Neonectria punicea]|uniref:Serine/threonine-protein phosphatase 2A activator n=1 Tax=Neonectria punicea TaxID=979145 RepID=A0ABR1H1T9_9HYPO
MASGTPPKPTLEILDLAASPPSFTKPAKRIHEGPDVARFLTSLAYRDIGTFILQLNLALCPRHQPDLPLPRTFPLSARPPSMPLPASIQALQSLLAKIDSFIGDAPPDPGPRRFGNVSFRKWYAILEERLDQILSEGPLTETMQLGEGKAKEELSSYLLGGFGSVQRLDYGTGHELSFVAFLGCLWKLGYFKDGNQGGEIERQIVLQVIEPYLRVVRKLILTYTLEPAGSHGVWGLDDHAFMPYIFGSAQLTRPINDNEPMPLEGSVRGAPKPSDVTKAAVVEDYRQTNMYFSAIGFINDVKTGPFWEHSPILFDISGIRDGWGKINKGMIKMFNAEVLSKFPVVQHFPFGSLFSWDMDPHAAPPTQSMHMANQPTVAAMAPQPSGAGTAAPWAQASRMPAPPGPGIPYSRVPPPGATTASHMPRPTQRNAADTGPTSAQITITKAPWARDS